MSKSNGVVRTPIGPSLNILFLRHLVSISFSLDRGTIGCPLVLTGIRFHGGSFMLESSIRRNRSGESFRSD
jgi:hypothetical protein